MFILNFFSLYDKEIFKFSSRILQDPAFLTFRVFLLDFLWKKRYTPNKKSVATGSKWISPDHRVPV